MTGAPGSLRAVVFAVDGSRRVGRLEGDTVVDAGPASERGFIPTTEAWNQLRSADGPNYPFDNVALDAPVRPAKILAIGINYRDHAAESNNEEPEEPVVFAKFPSSVIGHGQTIIVPQEETRPDWEGEMGIVIGRSAYRANAASARTAIGAITAVNDVSGRRAQLETPLKQFTMGKSFDTFTPMGPCLVDSTDIDLDDLEVTTVVSGVRKQHSSTSKMIYSAVELVEYLSRGVTLEPGDVIATGTPAGVGNRESPPRYLREGDIVEVSVSHVGTLRNAVKMESES